MKGGGKMKKMILCKTCGKEIAANAKHCPNCGGKNKKAIYKKWWFWVLLCLVVLIIVSNLSDSQADNTAVNSDVSSSQATGSVSEETTVEKALWAKEYYVDEFNQETDEWYVTNNTLFIGSFSNSATTDSGLTARILVDEEYVSIILFEYANRQVKNAYNDANHYTITMKDGNGNKYDLSGYMYADGDRIVIESNNKEKVINALKGEGNVSFYIYDTDRSVTSYLFTAITSNFDDLIE